MKTVSILSFFTLTESKYDSNIKEIGVCPNPQSDSCMIGGMSTKCMGKRCPKCWIKHTANLWACYEPIDGECEWKGMFHVDKLSSPCSKNDETKEDMKPINNVNECPQIGKDVCLRGGMENSPCSGLECPTCWIKSPSKRKWYCFERLEDKCDFFVGIIDVLQNSDKCPELCDE